MATKEELQKLKQNWLNDPIWDIEDTEGFEDHYEELKAYRKEREAVWDKHRTEQLIQRSIKMGVPGNTELVRYIEGLECKIQQLEKSIDQIRG